MTILKKALDLRVELLTFELSRMAGDRVLVLASHEWRNTEHVLGEAR